MPFHLTCKACQFEKTVQTQEECMEAMFRHGEEHTTDHLVEFKLIDEEPFFRGGVSGMEPESLNEIEP